MKIKHAYLIVIVCSIFFNQAFAQNTTINSFSKAKKLLIEQVYYDNKETVYCKANFTKDKRIILPDGFNSQKYKKRAQRLEWEHIVPAENFGRTFNEWREGHPRCLNKQGKAYKGRKCAEKTNKEFRYMLSDMYNLYPAIGAVNALRSNYNFTELSKDVPNSFGSCPMKIENRKVEPPSYVKGVIARTYLYMDKEYSNYNMSASMKKLMISWNKMYPVSDWECKRAERIEAIQGNVNNFVKNKCH